MRNAILVFALIFASPNFSSAAVQEAGLPVRFTASVHRERQAGIPPAWEVRPVFEEAARQAYALSALLDKIQLDRWPAAEQAAERELLQTARTQIETLRQNLALLAEQPTRLSVLLDAVFSLDRLVRQLDSSRRALANYQDIGLAIDLDRLLAAASANSEKLSAYAQDLARFQEDQLRSLTADVARCQQTQRERERAQRRSGPTPRKR